MPLLGTAALVGAAMILTVAALACLWGPALALLSDAADPAGLDQPVMFSLSNLVVTALLKDLDGPIRRAGVHKRDPVERPVVRVQR